jgi:hypothetical protein
MSEESLVDIDNNVDDLYLPEDEAYLASRASMHKSGDGVKTEPDGSVLMVEKEDEQPYGESHFGTRDMVFYDNYRRDELGLYILKLSRYSHLAIRFPGLKPIIEKLVKLPDNGFNRTVWKLTEGFLNIRVHAGAPWSYFFKYFLFHSSKQVR